MPYKVTRSEDYLEHHGIKGQKWGVKNGPPYPLDEEDKTAAEKKETKGTKKEKPLFDRVKLSDLEPEKWSKQYEDKYYSIEKKKPGYSGIAFNFNDSDNITQEKLDEYMDRVNKYASKLNDDSKKKALSFIYDDMKDSIENWTFGKYKTKKQFVDNYMKDDPYVSISAPHQKSGKDVMNVDIWFDGGQDFGYHSLTVESDENGNLYRTSIEG